MWHLAMRVGDESSSSRNRAGNTISFQEHRDPERESGHDEGQDGPSGRSLRHRGGGRFVRGHQYGREAPRTTIASLRRQLARSIAIKNAVTGTGLVAGAYRAVPRGWRLSNAYGTGVLTWRTCDWVHSAHPEWGRESAGP